MGPGVLAMARPSIVTCEQCGRTKGPSNRWFVELAEKYGYILYPSEEAPVEAFKTDQPWADLCGEQCAQLRLSQWMHRQRG